MTAIALHWLYPGSVPSPLPAMRPANALDVFDRVSFTAVCAHGADVEWMAERVDTSLNLHVPCECPETP